MSFTSALVSVAISFVTSAMQYQKNKSRAKLNLQEKLVMQLTACHGCEYKTFHHVDWSHALDGGPEKRF